MAGEQVQVALPLLVQLRDIHRQAVAKLPRDFDPGLASVGLIGLDDDMIKEDFRYEWCTPLNCRAFATTGGNGVHFGLLVRDGRIDDRSPVIVTIPGMVGDSFVVGESLWDFLCLGRHRGFFALEQLSYDLDLTLKVFTDPAWRPNGPHHDWVGFATGDY